MGWSISASKTLAKDRWEMYTKVCQNVFNGFPITTLIYKEKPTWILKEFGKLLGYRDNGSNLAYVVRTRWKGFEEPRDLFKVQYGELFTLKSLLKLDLGVSSPVHHSAKSVTLITKPGLNRLLKRQTRINAVTPLKAFLAHEIGKLPTIDNSKPYEITRVMEHVLNTIGEKIDTPDDSKLFLQEKQTLKKILKKLRSNKYVRESSVVLLEKAVLSHLRNGVTESPRWVSVSTIADPITLGIPSVCHRADELGLRSDFPLVAKCVKTKSGCKTYLYSPEAAQCIEDLIMFESLALGGRSCLKE